MHTTSPLTVATAAAQSGIPKRTIIAAINRGDLPAEKLPGLTGAFLLAKTDFDRWAAGRRIKAAS